MLLRLIRPLKLTSNLWNFSIRNMSYLKYEMDIIGKREIVGYGMNGQPEYLDREDFPFPAVRYSEPTPECSALKEKEKGDWRKLSMEEKKCLYRYSFCQTFSEFQHPTGEWKSILGFTLLFISGGLWLYILQHQFVLPELPESFCEENQRAQLRRMLDMRVGNIQGLSSKWDYENDRWK